MIWQAALVVLPSLLILCLLSAAKQSLNNRWTPSTIQCYGRGWGCVHKHILTNPIPCGNLVRSELAFVALAIVAWLTVSHQEKCLFTVSWFQHTTGLKQSCTVGIVQYICHQAGIFFYISCSNKVNPDFEKVWRHQDEWSMAPTIVTDWHVVIYRTFHQQLARIIYGPPVSLSRK